MPVLCSVPTFGKNPGSSQQEFSMAEDARCCGSGTCVIDAEGRCWCGQQWDGQRMSQPVHKADALELDTNTPVVDDNSPPRP
jgi:hypothetical protein